MAPKAKLRVDRTAIAKVLSSVLAEHAVEDVSVEDPPLEEVIAEMFARNQATEVADAAAKPVAAPPAT